MLEKASLEETLEALGACIALGNRLGKQEDVCKKLAELLAERLEAREKSAGFPAATVLKAALEKLEKEFELELLERADA